jgi:hypothetical protein
MLPMEPVGTAALVRALSWQIRRAFITADSQYGTSLSDRMALHCGWRLWQRGAVTECTVAMLTCSLQLTMWSWGRGSKGRFSSTSFCRGGTFAVKNGSDYCNAAAAGRASCRGGPVGGCSLRPTTSSSEVQSLNLKCNSMPSHVLEP